jgi:hypothetical protein
MKTDRILQFTVILAVLNILPITLFAQEDVSIEFSFNRPGEYICEIGNMADSRMIIWLNEEEADIHSNLYFYALNTNNDTVPVYYELWKDPRKHILRLDSGEVYTISYEMRYPERFVKARVTVKYAVIGSKSQGGFYEKMIDLREVRNKTYIPQVLRDDSQ